MNLFGYLDQAAARYGDRPAVCLGTDVCCSYAQLRERALRLAAGLRREHGAGVRIAIASENCVAFVEVMFAVWAAGMTLVPINAKLHALEMEQILQDAEAAFVFASPKIASALAKIGSAVKSVVLSDPEYEALLAEQPATPDPVAADDIAWLFYTSGTTGRSKGAMLSHRNLHAMSMAHLADIDDCRDVASLLHAAPMSHGSGLYVLPYVMRGARHIVPSSGSYDPAEFLDLCDVHPGVRAFLAPTMVQRLRLEATTSRARRSNNLRLIIYGGGPMYVDEIRKSLDVFGNVFAQIYGQGEAPMTITGVPQQCYDAADDVLLGSVGWARSGVEVRIVDNDNRPVANGVVGEVVCRGDVVMRGYWKNPDATAQSLCDGWLRTGDMGAMSSSGVLTLHDRSKDVIISGGSNIYPREVEEVLLAHPAVQEVSVIGRVDDEWGEIVIAYVVLSAPADADALDLHCIEKIARFKRPKHYVFVEALAKNSYGKVLKRDLRDLDRVNSSMPDARGT